MENLTTGNKKTNYRVEWIDGAFFEVETASDALEVAEFCLKYFHDVQIKHVSVQS